MDRQEANRQILKMITEMVENQPDLRFHQILFSLGINVIPDGLAMQGFFKNLFYEESVETLDRIYGKGENA